MNFFDIQNTFFETLGYRISYLEFFATVTGFVAVWLSARAHLWSWPIGLVNVTLFFFLAYQVQLYPDMFLQVFFFVTNVIGWWRWANPRQGEEDLKMELKVSWMPMRILILFLAGTLIVTLLAGSFASNLHEWFPKLFNKPSAFPYLDSFVMVTSIVATYLMVQKKVECWIAWFIADFVGVFLYFSKGIVFISLEFVAFTAITVFGYLRWRKEYYSYTTA